MVRRHRHTVPALIAAFLLGLVTIVPAAANNTAQTLPFTQNWTNTDLITAPITGPAFRASSGFAARIRPRPRSVDPQNTLGVSRVDERPRRDRRPDQPGDHKWRCRPNSSLPTQSLPCRHRTPSEAPYLLFHLDTTGVGNVASLVQPSRHRRSGDNAVQQVALQYRVGASGSFTNVPAGYVADATTGRAATLVTTVRADAARRGRATATRPGPGHHGECRRQRRVGRDRQHPRDRRGAAVESNP